MKAAPLRSSVRGAAINIEKCILGVGRMILFKKVHPFTGGGRGPLNESVNNEENGYHIFVIF
jgi:hypothetical protein